MASLCLWDVSPNGALDPHREIAEAPLESALPSHVTKPYKCCPRSAEVVVGSRKQLYDPSPATAQDHQANLMFTELEQATCRGAIQRLLIPPPKKRLCR